MPRLNEVFITLFLYLGIRIGLEFSLSCLKDTVQRLACNKMYSIQQEWSIPFRHINLKIKIFLVFNMSVTCKQKFVAIQILPKTKIHTGRTVSLFIIDNIYVCGKYFTSVQWQPLHSQ